MPHADGTKTLEELLGEIPDVPALIQRWKELVHDKAKEVDSNDECDWYSIGLGSFLGSGLTPEHAHALSTHIRYNTSLG